MTPTHAQLAERCAELFQTVQVPDSVKPFIAELLEALREAERNGRLYESLERAAGVLPDGCVVELCVENGSGYVSLNDGRGNRISIDSADRTMSEQVDAAIGVAINPEAKT